jgi:hypothetical protein
MNEMTDIERTATEAIRHTFGESSKVLSCSIIKTGIMSDTAKVQCSQYEKPFFIKIEHDFVIPRTQKYQIKREVAGIRLCKDKGIRVPALLSSDDSGKVCGKPWLIEEFIAGNSISKLDIGEESRKALGAEFESVFSKIVSIESGTYGDTFESGIIGKHNAWIDAVSRITFLVFDDCNELNVFDYMSQQIVESALQKALSHIKCITKPVFFHYDLLSGNVFGEEDHDEIHLGCLFDFGMSLFAPLHLVQYQTRMYTDFLVEKMNVCETYAVEQNELAAYEILRIEPILFMNLLGYKEGALNYVNQCREYLIT